MKKLIYILVALIAFSIGVLCFYLRPIVMPVSICQIKRNVSLYDKQTVHIKGYFSSSKMHENDLDYSDGISSIEKGCEAGANLDYPEKFKTNKILKKLHQEIWEKNKEINNDFDEGWYLAEVEIVGEVNDLSKDGITHCFSPDLSFEVKEIKQTSPVRFISRKDAWNLNNPE